MIIIETTIFTRLIKELMTDDEYRDLQEALITRPDRGDLIRGSGGLARCVGNLPGVVKVAGFV